MDPNKQQRIQEIRDALVNFKGPHEAAVIFDQCQRDADEHGADLEKLLKAEFKIIHKNYLDGLNFTNHCINIITGGGKVFPRIGKEL